MDTDTGKRRRAGDAVKYGDNSIIPIKAQSIYWHIILETKNRFIEGG